MPNPVVVDDGTKVLFAADDGQNGFELWATDGSAANTVLVRDINVGALGSDISYFRTIGSRYAYFAAKDNTTGREMWRSDGSGSGTQRVTDIWPSTVAWQRSAITAAFTGTTRTPSSTRWPLVGTS